MRNFKLLFLIAFTFYLTSCNDDNGVCSNPVRFFEQAQSSTSVTFTWDPWRNSESLTLEYGNVGFSLGNGTSLVIHDQGRTIISGLEPDTEYHYYYKSNCSNGTVEYDGPNLMRTQPVCEKLTGLEATEISQDRIKIVWEQNTLARYRIEYGPAGFELGDGIERGSDFPYFAATNLSPDTSYDFYVLQRCGPSLGNSEFSELKNVRTLP